MIRKLLNLGWILSFASAALSYLAGAAAEGSAVEVWLVVPHDARRVEENKALFDLDAPDRNSPDYPRKVAEIYGIPSDRPVRVVLAPKGKILHPPELPSMALLRNEPDKGDRYHQVELVRMLRIWSTGVAAGTGGVLLLLWGLLGRRAGTGDRPAAASP